MHNFIIIEDCELWDVIEDGSFVPTKIVKDGKVTDNVHNIKKEFRWSWQEKYYEEL